MLLEHSWSKGGIITGCTEEGGSSIRGDSSKGSSGNSNRGRGHSTGTGTGTGIGSGAAAAGCCQHRWQGRSRCDSRDNVAAGKCSPHPGSRVSSRGSQGRGGDVRQALATTVQAGRTEEEQSIDDDSSRLAGVKVAALVVGQQLETAASTDSTELQETAIAIGIDIASSAIAEAIASVVGQLKEGAANTKTIGPRWTRTQYRRMRRRRVLV